MRAPVGANKVRGAEEAALKRITMVDGCDNDNGDENEVSSRSKSTTDDFLS